MDIINDAENAIDMLHSDDFSVGETVRIHPQSSEGFMNLSGKVIGKLDHGFFKVELDFSGYPTISGSSGSLESIRTYRWNQIIKKQRK